MTNENYQHILQWTEAQQLGLAPDTFIMRAGQGNIGITKWESVGRTPHLAWGVFPNRSKPPFHVSIQFSNMAMGCTCHSKKSPCRHTLALLMLLIQTPEQFKTAVSPPAWFTAQHKRSIHRQQRQQTNNQSPRRLRLLRTGMAELELWLRDLVRHGLAALPNRPKQYWYQIADRMVDAEAPAAAHTLRQLANIPIKQSDWPERMLRRLGRLYLLVQSFNQWDSLSHDIQADLLTAVGWLPTNFNTDTVDDDWLVMGHTFRIYGKQHFHQTWLWGLTHNRPAMLIQAVRHGQPVRHIATHTLLHGTVQFAPGSTPLLATFTAPPHLQTPPSAPPAGYAAISPALNDYTQTITQNPWLPEFPMLLSAVFPTPYNNTWRLADTEGNLLPLKTTPPIHWHLLAVSSGHPLPVFGTWDGTRFAPISFFNSTNWLDLHTIRGVK